MNTVHKIHSRKKRVIHPLMSKGHNDVIKVIAQKSQLNSELKYDMWPNKVHNRPKKPLKN